MHRFVFFISALSLLACACGAPALAQDGAQALKPADSFRECDGCPEMVVVPAGSFTMGSPESEKGRNSWEGPQRVVTIARPFAVGKLEVTVDQLAAFVRETGYDAGSRCWTYEDSKFDMRSDRSWRNPGFLQDGSHPATCLSWDDAKAYTGWLATKTGSKGYRLLSEANGNMRPGQGSSRDRVNATRSAMTRRKSARMRTDWIRPRKRLFQVRIHGRFSLAATAMPPLRRRASSPRTASASTTC